MYGRYKREGAKKFTTFYRPGMTAMRCLRRGGSWAIDVGPPSGEINDKRENESFVEVNEGFEEFKSKAHKLVGRGDNEC
ncbi:unnamed protein product [Strongylus vulgaris]|uniref:Uncharacterized protein n=1 Tax=Strongylus vulgaris TaxID=40348 RepID=A0A3P7ITR1_STRVU|nr:unnamed protein product [Strongylus vulgaris]